ncbi:hypothetical protein [Terrisporobacter sp.]|uniref:hypothetical protein n=1 Tax=Terrisporobacter sp. TaxID=1965305 RepID=UPI002897CB59|nr:hypothetical protein [Terrisporobacter sp.]
MEEIANQFLSLGAVGVIAYTLFKNTLEEKKEDRELYRKSVETFAETSKSYAESITTLSVRVENVEEVNGRIETKIDKILEKKEGN